MAAQKHENFGAISENFATWMRISPDCNQISSVGKRHCTCTAIIPEQRKMEPEFGPTQNQLFWVLIFRAVLPNKFGAAAP